MVTTGQGLLGNNMFAYCLNNPVNYRDNGGFEPEALLWWTTSMSWLPFVDLTLPIGDILFVIGVVVFTAVYASSDDNLPAVQIEESDVGFGPPSPNNNGDDDDDDDLDDDYYDDDNNFGGRQKVGKSKGNTPRSNKAQNKQIDKISQKLGLNNAQRDFLHDYITKQGLGYQEVLDEAISLFFK